MKRLINILLTSLAWLLFAALVVFVADRVRDSREKLTISSLTININGDVDSPHAKSAQPEDDRSTITEKSVRSILAKNKVELVGRGVNTVSFTYVEKLLVESGYIDRAECYVDVNGEMTIDVWRRSAAIRLLLDGYNNYLTEDGFVFSAPKALRS